MLTIVQYSRPTDATTYVNSMWEMQKEPYKGDVINSYNDGPPAPGKPPLGPFYELETSSPALSLQPASTTRTSIGPFISWGRKPSSIESPVLRSGLVWPIWPPRSRRLRRSRIFTAVTRQKLTPACSCTARGVTKWVPLNVDRKL